MSFSSSRTAAPPPAVDPGTPLCVYANTLYSAGARVAPPNAQALECSGDGSWRPL